MSIKNNFPVRVLLLLGILTVFGCIENSQEKPDFKYELNYPSYFPELEYDLEPNPISKEGFELGRQLFFEKKLSSDESISCGSCHLQGLAWADNAQHRFSIGVNESTGTRNTPSLQNLGFIKDFVWDGGVSHLDFVPINAIENKREMNETLVNVVAKLKKTKSYPTMFENAFGTKEISSAYILKAISQFMLMMVSSNSRYDQMLRGEIQFTPTEELGLKTFESNCASCHEGVLQSNFTFQNNGIDSVFDDVGRGRITMLAKDTGAFRVPTLRNVELSAPYMHSGKFATLSEVIDHYSEGVLESTTLSEVFTGTSAKGFHFSKLEKQAIIEFLKTLTDREFTNNPMFFVPEAIHE